MPLRVVLIDDEADLCQVFGDMFASPLVDVRTFTDPEAGVRACAEGVDLVFLDYRLQGVTGEEVATRIAPEVPVAILTGEISLQPSDRVFQVFQKPWDYEEIFTVISGFLTRSGRAS